MTDEAHRVVETERYQRAAHRVQTAIGAVPEHPNQTQKHMRTGIDMSKSDLAGLSKLLIDKGLFTLEEYLTAIADQAEVEADTYEHEISIRFGINITTL